MLLHAPSPHIALLNYRRVYSITAVFHVSTVSAMKIHVAQPTHDALQELGGFQLERRQDDVISVRVLVRLITCIPAKYHDYALVTH